MNKKKSVFLVIIIFLLVFLFIATLLGILGYIFLFSAKNTEIYACAISQAKKNENIIKKIGKPIEPGTLVYTKHWGYGDFHERAEFNTSLTGSKGSGTLYVQAYLDINYSSLRLIFEDEKKTEVIYEGTFPCERK